MSQNTWPGQQLLPRRLRGGPKDDSVFARKPCVLQHLTTPRRLRDDSVSAFYQHGNDSVRTPSTPEFHENAVFYNTGRLRFCRTYYVLHHCSTVFSGISQMPLTLLRHFHRSRDTQRTSRMGHQRASRGIRIAKSLFSQRISGISLLSLDAPQLQNPRNHGHQSAQNASATVRQVANSHRRRTDL